MQRLITKFITITLLLSAIFNVSNSESSKEPLYTQDKSLLPVVTIQDQRSIALEYEPTLKQEKSAEFSCQNVTLEQITQAPEYCFVITGIIKSIINPNLTIVIAKHSTQSKIVYVNSRFIKVKFAVSKLKDLLLTTRLSGSELFSSIEKTGPKDLVINSSEISQRMVIRKTILSLSLLQNYRC